jgi:single-stranded DNA-specific DHH superfamily exonuclease
MLSEKENREIREHLERAQNPLFYFDNDQDGLCSYLLIRRFLERGNGVPVKTSPLDMSYFRRVNEFEPDYIFILDQPSVSIEFFEALHERNIPLVWIDHHDIDLDSIPGYVNYYNPLFNKSKTNEPVADLCYRLVNRKEDLWLLIVGCISDKYTPKEYSRFLEKYPDLGIDSDSPFEILYNSEIGKIARMIGTGLKDRTSLVMKMIRFLIKVKTPYEVLDEQTDNHEMHKHFGKIDERLQKYLRKAREEQDGGKVLFFTYSGATSMSADIANRLSHDYPDKIIVVAFVRQGRVNLSIRGKGVREKVLNVLENFPLSTGGGHEDAVGAQIDSEQLKDFEKLLKEKVEGWSPQSSK